VCRVEGVGSRVPAAPPPSSLPSTPILRSQLAQFTFRDRGAVLTLRPRRSGLVRVPSSYPSTFLQAKSSSWVGEGARVSEPARPVVGCGGPISNFILLLFTALFYSPHVRPYA